jgi:hypothetical protein
MKTTHCFVILVAALVLISFSDRAHGDTFGSGANTFDIEFVDIGNPGNPADTASNPNPPAPTRPDRLIMPIGWASSKSPSR